MDKATLLPLRGSLGRKPGRAAQAKVRARKEEKEQKKRKKQKNKKEMCKEKNKKKEKKRKDKNTKIETKKTTARKVENPQRAALAKVRAQKERLNTRVYLNPELRKA